MDDVVLGRQSANKKVILKVMLETQAHGMKTCLCQNAPGAGKLYFCKHKDQTMSLVNAN